MERVERLFWTDSSLGLAWPCHFCFQVFFGLPSSFSVVLASLPVDSLLDAAAGSGEDERLLMPPPWLDCNWGDSAHSTSAIFSFELQECQVYSAWEEEGSSMACLQTQNGCLLLFLRFHVPGSELGQWPQTHVDEANFKNSSLEALVLLQASWVEEQFPVLLGLIKKFSKKDFRTGISSLGAEDDLSCLLDSFFLWGRLKWKCAVDMLYFWHCALFLIVSNLLFLATSATCALVSGGSSYKHIASSSPTPASPDPAYCVASLGP